ncbi:MAG TPA: hypothetical protein VEI54_03750 [Candidatus Limnocylindrales bacterium]|nr:hypothetical protein [Candidatus Limnocylindrales bacterium]
MPHLLIPRKGWENERLAAYLLSRFSFVAHPVSVADDVGSDFFCTIFEVQQELGRDVLVPRSSFAIQVKSSTDKVTVDNKIEYLMRLELPFFIGVVSQGPARMEIYSAEFLPMLFSDVGQPSRLSLVPVTTGSFNQNNYFERTGTPNDVRLKCPLVAEFSVDDDRSAIAAKVNVLLRICTRTLSNIATRVNEEHIYQVNDQGEFRIVAGPGSAKFFRMNFIKRLGEVFFNLSFLLGDAPPDEQLSAEIEVFHSLVQKLKSLKGYGPTLPTFVTAPYQVLRQKLPRIKNGNQNC